MFSANAVWVCVFVHTKYKKGAAIVVVFVAVANAAITTTATPRHNLLLPLCLHDDVCPKHNAFVRSIHSFIHSHAQPFSYTQTNIQPTAASCTHAYNRISLQRKVDFFLFFRCCCCCCSPCRLFPFSFFPRRPYT